MGNQDVEVTRWGINLIEGNPSEDHFYTQKKELQFPVEKIYEYIKYYYATTCLYKKKFFIKHSMLHGLLRKKNLVFNILERERETKAIYL